jgi:EmrB/QacA subfamily drug resistance transporter
MQYKWTVLSVTTIGTLMASLDSRILVIGLPTIARQLHAGAEEVIWITQAYQLTLTIFLLMIGRLSDLFGRIRLYNLGFALFTVGSGLCSLAQDPFQLIFFRVVQGTGGALLSSNSIAILTDSTPPKQLGTFLGINQTAYRLGAMAGLTFSGIILSFLTWRALFYLNIPFGVFGAVWAYRQLREIATKDTNKKLDWVGFALFTCGLSLVMLAITYLTYGLEGYLDGVLFLVLGGILLALFVRQESVINYPLLDLQMLKIRIFGMGAMAQAMNAITWGSIILLAAFYLQVGLGYSPLIAGLAIIPMDVAFLISALIFGRLSDIHGSRKLTIGGLVVITSAFLIMATWLNISTPYTTIALTLSLVGVGFGMFSTPNQRAIMASVPANRRGIASGFVGTMFGIGFTVSYGITVFLITFGIQYANFSYLLQSSLSQTGLLEARMQFVNGFHIALVVMAVIDAIAIIPSIMRSPASPVTRTESIPPQ